MTGKRWMGVALVGAACLSLPHVAGAQEISKGLNLVGVSLTYDHSSSEGSSMTNATVGGSFEHFLTDKISAAALITYNHVSAGGDAETFGEFSAAGMYYLTPEKDGSPYVGARVGKGFGRDDDNPFSFGAGIGYLKIVGSKTRGAAFKAELAYLHRKFENYSSNDIVLGAGVSFYFRSR